MDTLSVEASYEWRPVEEEPGKAYAFPHPLTDYMRDRYAGPAVFRWVLGDDEGGRPRVCLGEALALIDRLRGLLHPSAARPSDARLQKALTSAALFGSDVRLEQAHLAALRVGERAIDPQRAMSNKALRRLVESLLVAEHQQAGYALLSF